MKRIKINGREFKKNPNDCWNEALARAANKTYDQTRKELQVFIKENGCVIGDIIYGYLWTHGYKAYHINKRSTAREIIQMIDTENNKLVLDFEDHTSFVNQSTFFDLEEHLDNKVEMIFVKAV